MQLFALCSFSVEGQLYTLSPQNIVQNPSFEDFTGFPNMAIPWVGIDMMHTVWNDAPDGVNYTHLDGYIYQTLATTPGQRYQLSFFAAPDLVVNPSATIQVYWASQAVASFSTASHPGTRPDIRVWEQFSTTVVAETSSTVLGFAPLNNTQFYFDAVEAAPIPEPSGLIYFLFAAPCIFASARVRCERLAKRHAIVNQRRFRRFDGFMEFRCAV